MNSSQRRKAERSGVLRASASLPPDSPAPVTPPPAPDPIAASIREEDGKFAVYADASAAEPLAIFDTEAEAQAFALGAGVDGTTIEAAPAETVTSSEVAAATAPAAETAPTTPAAPVLSLAAPLAASAKLRCSKPQIVGGPLDAAGIRWHIILVQAGPAMLTGPTGRQGYVPVDAIKAAVKAGVFAGSYLNHPLAKDEELRPERNAEDKIGRLSDVKWDSSIGPLGAAVGIWHCYDAVLRARLLDAHNDGGLGDFLDFSIYGPCAWAVKTIDGKEYDVVDAIEKASADLVTDGAAGGTFQLGERLAASLRMEVPVMDPITWARFATVKAALAEAMLLAASDDTAVSQLDALALTFKDGERATFVTDLKAARASRLKASVEPVVTPAPTPVAAAMVPCPACAKDNAADAKYCDQCGASMKPAVASVTPSTDPTVTAAANATVTAAATETKEIAASLRGELAVLKAEKNAAHLDRRIAEFDPVDQDFIRGQLSSEGKIRASVTPVEIDRTCDAHKAYLGKRRDAGADNGFPISASVTAIPGADEIEKYIAGIDGLINRRDVKTKDGQTVERFASLRAAIQAHPRYRREPLDLSAHRLPSYVFAPFYAGDVDPVQHPETRNSPGPYVVRMSNGERRLVPIAASMTTASFGEIFADREHKSFMREYNSAAGWEDLMKLASDDEYVTDFGTYRKIRIGEYINITQVVEGGTYPTVSSPADVEETGALAKYGGIEDLTFELMNDPDGQKLLQIPAKLGHAMGRTIRETFLNVLTTDNPTMNADSVALYDAAHANTGTTAFSLASLETVRQAMHNQTAAGSSKKIGGDNGPKYLLMPVALTSIAERVTNPSPQYTFAMNDDTSQVLDPAMFKGKGLEVIEVTHATDTNNWFAMSDPKKMPTVCVLRLRGVPQPEFFQQFDPESPAMFDADKGKVKVRFWFKAFPLDHRSFYRQVVA